MSEENETALSAAIRGALDAQGFWTVRQQVSGRRGRRSIASGEKGMPDILIVTLGAWLEVKLPKGKLSPEQEAWHAKAHAAGVKVATVRTVQDALRQAIVWRDQK